MGVAHIFGLLAVHADLAASPPLGAELERLSGEGAFSGAVVIRDAQGVRFARAWGFADPFEGRPFSTATPSDSASLAKPVTAAAVLALAEEGRIDLDAPAARYLAEFPHPETTVRHLLTHSAGLPDYDQLEPIAGKSASDLLVEIGRRRLPPAFPAGSAFSYCNICYDSLALLVERVSGRPYLDFARERIGLPPQVDRRPQAVGDWQGRAIGHRRAGAELERVDSFEGEAVVGAANLSIAADALAAWGASWWSSLAPLRESATAPARVASGVSGLALGSWYCAPGRTRCHYLGHHQGFHHMLYWDAERRISVALMTNNSLAPDLQQRLQRAIVAFAGGEDDEGRRELARRLPRGRAAAPGAYRTGAGEILTVLPGDGPPLQLTRRGVAYPLYPIDDGIFYAPGLDLYVAGSAAGGLHLLGLYEDEEARPLPPY
jgi:CubicO group peptidase (beta-lactamase class C family)